MRSTFLLLFQLSLLVSIAQPKLTGNLYSEGKKSGGSIFRSDLPGMAPDTIHIFDNLAPHAPSSGLTVGEDDFIYGMLQYNGDDMNGCLYKIRRDGSDFTVVDKLTNSPGALTTPFYHTDGMIYFNNEFELRRYDPSSGTVSLIPINSGTAQKNLWIDADDWIYLTTEIDELAKIKTDGTGWTILHSMDASTEGYGGVAGLVEIPGDTLFGVNRFGGSDNGGTLFSIKKDGSAFTVYHQFTSATGFEPESKLVYFDGKLYGTARQGGSASNGVVYRINSDGSNYEVLHEFAATAGGGDVANNISISGNGTIFGSFQQFASDGTGFYRFYKLDTSGQNYQLFYYVDQHDHGHSNQQPLLLNDSIFLATASMGRHEGGVLTLTDTIGVSAPFELIHFGQSLNGFHPNPILKGSDSKLYGTTVIGGTTGNGILYSMNFDGTGYTRLHEFSDAEGYDPAGRVLEASDGRLYGICSKGGNNNSGSLFSVERNGANFSVLFDFPTPASAKTPQGNLIEDHAGALFGTQRFGSTFFGALYRINKDGSGYNVLHDFVSGDLSRPSGQLVLVGNYLYGTCLDGGAANSGGIYRIKTDGSAYEVLHEFNGTTDGMQTQAGLLLASNGKLYGTTSSSSVLFRIDTTGANYTILHSFDPFLEGGAGQSELIQASDGLIYGTTSYSGPGGGGGILFNIAPDGSGFTEIRSFDVNINGEMNMSLIDLQPPVVLPVHFIDLSAARIEDEIKLSWTANEWNTAYYQVERWGSDQHALFIGRVNASSNPINISSYSFTDHQPLKGLNYYRLKAVDHDGQYKYSAILAVNNSTFFFILAPNPVRYLVHLEFNAGNSLLRIVDQAGRIVLEQSVATTANHLDVDVSKLPKGWYSMELTGLETQRKIFLKQ